MTPAVRPPRLRPGDRVSVVAPCGPVTADRLDAALDTVRGWGLDVVCGAHVRERHPTLPYLAGDDADRAADLQEAWTDPGTAAVLCARGGDGAHRILDLLDFDALRRGPAKVLVGFSDITALHEAFALELGVATLHGPVIATQYFVDDEVAQSELRATLFEPETRRTLAPPAAETLVGGTAHGVLIGGNLSLLCGGLGTPRSRSSAAGGILLLEDVQEDISRIDRMLTQLLRTGWLRGVAGVVLGSWTDCDPGPEQIRALMLDRLAPLGVPVVGGFGFGHLPGQLTVPLGVTATLDADARTLRLDEPALA
ncbi:muramoyltetrapeptide carboxypeptidase [Nocardiopsis mwathae]|uniref:Muramoyltetrapeptide carboxypeptidase n=1 Tax=Nocardiopsis mwathae TaxID=1472723 RepID=A0A7X0D720_9ACTN|nr:LD-carboxypeptidase [Nocardiopsis mwathae]MBB6172609.1 muramoyltetrapeptide carboxypeptidase [Nocardiopsis mwathae]